MQESITSLAPVNKETVKLGAEKCLAAIQKNRNAALERAIKEKVGAFSTGFLWWKKWHQRTREEAEKLVKEDSYWDDNMMTYHIGWGLLEDRMENLLSLVKLTEGPLVYLSREDAGTIQKYL